MQLAQARCRRPGASDLRESMHGVSLQIGGMYMRSTRQVADLSRLSNIGAQVLNDMLNHWVLHLLDRGESIPDVLDSSVLTTAFSLRTDFPFRKGKKDTAVLPAPRRALYDFYSTHRDEYPSTTTFVHVHPCGCGKLTCVKCMLMGNHASHTSAYTVKRCGTSHWSTARAPSQCGAKACRRSSRETSSHLLGRRRWRRRG